VTPIHGGDVPDVAALHARLQQDGPPVASPPAREALAYNHGSAADEILAYGDENRELLTTFDGETTFRAEVVHACRVEMAQTLADILLRRTDLAAGRTPSDAVVQECAHIAARELGWSDEKLRTEISGWESTMAGRLVRDPAGEPVRPPSPAPVA
jgi:glycerol-3-phosphate dehydrogenase